MKRIVLLGAVISLLGASGLAVAQTSAVSMPADNIIAARQALMDLQNGIALSMKGAVDGKTDLKPFADSAKALVASTRVIPTLFPAGTETGHNTKAKPEIWSDHAGFEKAAGNVTAAAEKLAQLADANDKEGFAAQFQVMGRACGACHRQYRSQ